MLGILYYITHTAELDGHQIYIIFVELENKTDLNKLLATTIYRSIFRFL